MFVSVWQAMKCYLVCLIVHERHNAESSFRILMDLQKEEQRKDETSVKKMKKNTLSKAVVIDKSI